MKTGSPVTKKYMYYSVLSLGNLIMFGINLKLVEPELDILIGNMMVCYFQDIQLNLVAQVFHEISKLKINTCESF